MSGFLSLYDDVDRVDLGGGFWVDIAQHITDAANTLIQRALISPRVETVNTEGDVRVQTTTIDQGAYSLARLVAYIVDWNLTDRNGDPLPLPIYIQPSRDAAGVLAEHRGNAVRRQSIGFLPPYATNRILLKIVENEKRFEEGAGPFPGPPEGAPAGSPPGPPTAPAAGVPG